MAVNESISRIVIIGPAHPFRGGIADTNEAMARAFQRAGHEVELVTFTVQYPSLVFPGKSQFSDDSAPERLRIHRWIHSFNPLNWIGAARKIAQLNPDVVIIRYWLPLMAPCFGSIARLLGKRMKVIGLTDNVIPHETRLMDTLFTRYFMSACDGFMALSEAVAGDLKSLSDKPSSHYPHPINDQLGALVEQSVARAALHLPEGPFYLLFFGFIRPYKGLDLLLEALADDRLKKADVHLIVAGEAYESLEPYHALVEQKQMQDRVHWFTDFIPNEKVPLYFGAADWVAQTYRTATQSGITQMALHFEVPALITKVGGLEEFVVEGKTGYFCEPQVPAIAQQIVNIVQEQGNTDYTASIQAQKRRFSWDAFVAHFNQFISRTFTT